MNWFILKLDFRQDIPYYIRVGDGEYHEIYNPCFATPFPTKEAAQIWANTNTTHQGYVSAVDMQEACDLWDKWTSEDTIRRSFSIVDNSFSRKYDPLKDTPLDVLKFFITQKKGKPAKQRDYESWPWPYVLFKHIFRVNLYRDTEKNKRLIGFELFTGRNGSVDVFKEELSLIIPLNEWMEDGYHVFEIFDHYLSEGGNIAYFHYKSDEDCFISYRYGDVPIKGGLEKVFSFWRDKRYYNTDIKN